MASGSDNSWSRALAAFRGTRQRKGGYRRRWSSRLRSNRIETSGPGLDTGLAALLDHRDGHCHGRFRRAEFLAGRAQGVRSAERGQR
jgi:hypothetical protein